MPLVPGTALQNGHYVIDALLEAAPNGDLYYGTHIAVGMPVFIQVFPLADVSGHNDLSSLIARLEGVAFSRQSPLPNPFQLFRGDDQTLCLAMGKPVGLPWSLARRQGSPMSPKQALSSIRQMASSISWLKEQGIVGLDLSANRVWLSTGRDQITLTGLPHPYLENVAAATLEPDTSVQSLAKLLFSFLTGELLQSGDAENHVIRTKLNEYRPTLSPLIVEAIELGIRSPATEPLLSLDQWLEQLPDAGAAYQVQPPSRQLTRSPAPSVATTSKSLGQSRRLTALAGTALMATIGGVALGTFWRLNAQSLPGAIQLEPKQSFPSQAEWSGDTPVESFDSPFVPARNAPRRETWYDSTIPDTFDAPAEAAPVESVEIIDDAESTVDAEIAPSEFSPSEESLPAEAPAVPLDALPDTPVAPAPSPQEAPSPIEAPLDSDSVDFSNVNDTLLQPVLETNPKAMPATHEATSEG